jgi:hypothetical protein
MKRVALAVLLATFALSPAMAQGTCQSKAIGKDGRPLAGAALNSFLTKCAKDTCEPKAIDKNGKPLAGAAKASFLKKCGERSIVASALTGAGWLFSRAGAAVL